MFHGERTGTVTPLDSVFTSEEAEKAARHVVEAIADRQRELHRLHGFIADNSVLIHHVQKLPDELSHDIMVPFGGAAFLPGRLVHTNEFMVLLGEGYYAERSAKQTVKILQRRGKSLEAHLQSLKRIIKDLDAEAKFFELTAAEVAGGLVEINEEYVEEMHSKEPEKDLSSRNLLSPSKVHDSVVTAEKYEDAEGYNCVVPNEEEDAKIMARLCELEKEEEETAGDISQDENNESSSFEEEEEEEEEKVEEEEESEDMNYNAENVSRTADKVPGLKMHIASGGPSESTIKPNNLPLPLETRAYLQKPPPSNIQSSSGRIPTQIPKLGSSESKAFTGTVIEHCQGLSTFSPANDSAPLQPSRPISRFKMQKGSR